METLPLDRARWPFIALLVSAAMLATAHAFERFGGYLPCPLCYTQRQVYWLAGALALITVAVSWRGAPPRLMLATCVLLGLVFLGGAGVAGYHSLVEWGVLPPPATCAAAGSGAIDMSNILEKLNRPMHVPQCGVAAWRDPVVHLSMAGWNTLVSLALAALSFVSAARPMRTDTANEPVKVEFGEETA